MSWISLEIKETIDEAIYAHSRWKTRLKNMINSGQSDVPLKNIRDPHHCQFGQWLGSSTEAKKSKYYNEVIKLHVKFHEKAAEVAGLAISGQSESAKHKMEIGSVFSKTSAKLVNILADWKGNL